MHLAGRQNIVVWFGLLQDPPHALDIIAGMAPVTSGVEVTDVELLIGSEVDGGDRTCHLARDESLAADRAFVIEQYSIRGVQSVGLAVIDGDPVRIELGDPV